MVQDLSLSSRGKFMARRIWNAKGRGMGHGVQSKPYLEDVWAVVNVLFVLSHATA